MGNAIDDAPFLRAILAAYRDDGPRLLYADYLEESPDPADQARGEFIRLQLALAKLSDDHPRRKELTAKQNSLWQSHQGAWTSHLYGLAAGFQFRRGLLDAVSVDAAMFLAKGEELFRRAPIRRVKLNDAGRHIAKLGTCPHLGRVRELDLCGNDLGNGGLNVLLRSPHLGRVESLDISYNGIDEAGAGRLAESLLLPQLRALRINGNSEIGSAGLAALAESPGFAGVRFLDISGSDIDDKGIAALVRSEHAVRLHTLILHGNHIGDDGLAVLATSELLSRLLAHEPRLDLRQNQIGAAGLKKLLESPRILPVVALDLAGNSLGDGGAHALATSAFLPKLRRLALAQNRMGNFGAIALAHSPLMERLAFLDVSSNALTQEGIDALWTHRKDLSAVVEYAGNYAGTTRG